MIDLLFVNNPDKVLFAGACDVPGISDHFFIYMAYSLKKDKFKPYSVTQRDFKNIDFDNFDKAVELAPWENVFSVDSVNCKVTILENIMNELLDKFAPYKTFVISKPNTTPWITPEIVEVMNKRDRLKVAFNRTNDITFLNRFKVLKNKVTSMRRKSLGKMFNETLNSKVKNSKQFYDAVKKLNVMAEKSNKGNYSFSPEKLNETFLKNNNERVNENFVDEKIRELYNTTLPCIHKFSFSQVSERDVIRVVRSIKTMSTGMDGINAFILKLFIKRISGILTHIINISFERNTFPDRWKLANILPIPKISVPLNESDFRPISILNMLSKIIEKFANKQIIKYLNKHALLDPNQSAYKEHFGTMTALLKITDDLMDAIDYSEISLLVLLDFSKAFDTVNHRILIEKLNILGFDRNSREWILSYLSDRSQRVKIGNNVSNWAGMENGVPQGSILGPLLFTILISDMRNCIWDGSYHCYADDTQFQIEMKPTENDINEKKLITNNVLTKISKYCKDTFLKLNEKKCMYMFIGSKPAITKLDTMDLIEVKINNNSISRVKLAKNLGVTFDEVLSWRKHVNMCVSKAMGSFIKLVRFKRFLSEKSKKLLCDAVVLSQFNYCDVVFINMDNNLQHKIQKIQDICIKFIFNIKKSDQCNYKLLRSKIEWLDMHKRRLLHSLTLLYKTLNNSGPDYLNDMFTLLGQIQNSNTRSSANNIWIDKTVKSKIHLRGFRIYIARVWNLLPENIKTLKSVNTFKLKLKHLLLHDQIVLPTQ